METAKNLIMAGPHSVTLHDDAEVVIADLGANFYLQRTDVGKPRAQACHHELQVSSFSVFLFFSFLSLIWKSFMRPCIHLGYSPNSSPFFSFSFSSLDTGAEPERGCPNPHRGAHG